MFKTVGRVEIKDADKGTFVALFAKFNTIDKDGDVTHPGAFPEGKKVPVSDYGHASWEGKVPVGSAEIKQTSHEAQAHGRFYTDTPQGDAVWKTLRHMHGDGIPSEWSYGYEPKDYSFGEFEGQNVRFLKQVDVFEVSPVLRGAGEGTQTLSIKSHPGTSGHGGPPPLRARTYTGVMPVHECDTTDAPWHPYDVLKDLGMASSIEDLRAVHAYVDPDADPALKTSYAFLHHAAPNGPASVRACLLGIAALNGAAGPTVADSAKQGVYDHLAAHLRDAGRAVPELRTPGGTLKLNDHALVVLADVGELIARTRAVDAARALKGRGLTQANTEVLHWLRDSLDDLRSILDNPEEKAAYELARAIQRARTLPTIGA